MAFILYFSLPFLPKFCGKRWSLLRSFINILAGSLHPIPAKDIFLLKLRLVADGLIS